jgi:ribonuclease R
MKNTKKQTTINNSEQKTKKDNENLLEGVISGTKQSYAFCYVENYNDFFIPATKTKGAIHGDRVLIKPIRTTGQSSEAQVIKILSRANKVLVGEIIQLKNQLYFKADNPKISKYVLLENSEENKKNLGLKVLCNLYYQPHNDRERFKGKIVEVLGDREDVSVLETAILREYNIYETFPAEVSAKAISLNKQGVTKKDMENRLDLTNEEMFTIDGEDAKDFDDAISLKILPNGNYYLGVHIADVGHYVPRDSVIDKEAFLRGTSVYFPTLTFPMLPEELSNGICSLSEDQNRLTVSVFIEIDNNGDIVNHKICESVIKSKARLTYMQVHHVLSGASLDNKAGKFATTLEQMNKLAKILQNKMKQNGELDFDLREVHFVVDESNKIIAVEDRERNDAHKLIESFMIIANQVVSKHHFDLKLPFIYRVHETPTLERVGALLDFLKNFDLQLPPLPQVITPHFFKDILKQVNTLNIKETLNKVVLRSLKKAVYKPERLGHFGLALMDYCHFTSPIRRYSDLVIHRIIKDNLHGKRYGKDMNNYVFESSEQASLKERNADEAERAMDDLKKAQYMKDFVGQEFEAIITSVTNFGFFVELSNTVEGLVRIETLPKDSYLFFEKSLQLKGANHTYSIGESISVVLVNVSLQERKIDFVLKETLNQVKNA